MGTHIRDQEHINETKHDSKKVYHFSDVDWSKLIKYLKSEKDNFKLHGSH